jgi:hypothetical protein
MKPDLEDLKITARELEKLTGVEVNDVFVGGVLGGTYRPSIFQSSKRLVSFCLTQLFVAILIFIFTLPIGLLLIRNSTRSINDLPTIFLFLGITSGIALIIIIGWNIYMRWKAKSLTTLAHLLDEVDKYNEVLRAVDVLDRLEAIGNLQPTIVDRSQVLAALNVTRNSLVCGLMSEKILRENRGLLARRYELFSNIENNLTTLQTLDVTNQANEYAELLNEALQIGISVHQEVQQLSTRR